MVQRRKGRNGKCWFQIELHQLRVQWNNNMCAKDTYPRETYLYGPLSYTRCTCSPTKRCVEDTGAHSLGHPIFLCTLLHWYWLIMLALLWSRWNFFCDQTCGFQPLMVSWVVEVRFLLVIRQGPVLQSYPADMIDTEHIFWICFVPSPRLRVIPKLQRVFPSPFFAWSPCRLTTSVAA